jgi:hypothetical protein
LHPPACIRSHLRSFVLIRTPPRPSALLRARSCSSALILALHTLFEPSYTQRAPRSSSRAPLFVHSRSSSRRPWFALAWSPWFVLVPALIFPSARPRLSSRAPSFVLACPCSFALTHQLTSVHSPAPVDPPSVFDLFCARPPALIHDRQPVVRTCCCDNIVSTFIQPSIS